jgi:hypothetical protein
LAKLYKQRRIVTSNTFGPPRGKYLCTRKIPIHISCEKDIESKIHGTEYTDIK